MRSLVLLVAIGLGIVACPQPAHAQPKPGSIDERTLTAAELGRYIEPYVPAIRACYLTHTRGRSPSAALRLEIIVHRDGSVWKLGVVAPGVKGRRLEACVQKLAQSWHFPVRAGFTTAVIPFFFQRTRAPGAGPQPGCVSARGCPEKKP